MRHLPVHYSNFLLAAFIDAEITARWTEAEWGLAVRQARSANLLASLASRIAALSNPDAVPEKAREHFRAAQNVIDQRNAAVMWECRQLRDALARVGVEPIFLKGAAYVVAELPLARHRHFADIDLMVPKERLGAVETQLMLSGWLTTNNDPYDQRYYRKWMHEIPPLQQIRRGTTLDLHHAITPQTARYQARTGKLFGGAIRAAGIDGVRVLNPFDMILHAATHLFAEGEAESALRNLVDVAELLRHFQNKPGFNAELVGRAYEVGLARPLFYAVHFVDKVLRQDALVELKQSLAPASPGKAMLGLLEAIYEPVFQGNHPSVSTRCTRCARRALYLRGHWLRMPGHLLVPHLIRKLAKTGGHKKQEQV